MLQKMVIALLVIAFAVTACSPQAATQTAPPTAEESGEPPAEPTGAPAVEPTATPRPEPDKVVLAVNQNLSNAIFFVAMAEGFFEEQNIEIEVVQVSRAADAVALLVSGDLDVYSGGINQALINALAAEPGLRVVSNKGQAGEGEGCVPDGIFMATSVVENGALESADSIAGLVFEGRASSFGSFIIDTWLEAEYGLSLDDVAFEEIPNEALEDALANGAVHGGTAQQPQITLLADTGLVQSVAPYGEVIEGIELTYLAYGKKLTLDNPELGNRFMVAYLQAVRQLYNDGKSDRNVEIIAEATTLEPEFVRRVCWATMNPAGEINYAGVLQFMEWAFERGEIERVLTEDEYWDSSYVEFANQALGAP